MDVAEKRKKISIEEKVLIIQQVEANPLVSRVELAKQLKLAPSTLNTIIKKKSSILEAFQKCGNAKRMRMKPSTYDEMEQVLITWFQQARASNIPINGTILKEKALQIALLLGLENFKASNGWIDKFRQRHGVVYKAECGESDSVDQHTVTQWLQALPSITSGYEPQNIFNADETGVFFNLMPDKTLAFRGENCHGGKKSKERLTVLLCTNADGSEKLKPLVIGKPRNPRCFKNISTLPCKYTNNAKAWMTSEIFLNFLREFDAKMGSAARRVLLFVDRCAAHPPDVSFLRNVKVVFLPPNCTSRLQPLDLGIIHALKIKYRTALVRKALNVVDQRKPGSQLKLNILQAMNLIMYSWREVSDETIKNCFKKAGLQEIEMVAPVEDYDSDFQEFHELVRNSSVTFEDFVTVDDSVATTGVLSIEELTTERSEENGSENDSDSESEDIPVPSYTKAAEAFETFKRYMMAQKLEETTLTQLNNLEQEMILIESRRNRKQTCLLEYFKKS